MYKLAAECQALGIKLAKKFQVLSHLEAIHCNSIQGTVHKMLTMVRSACEAAYVAVIQDKVPDDKREATTHHLHSEANVAWKEMHKVMYNHQLHYDGQLATFLVDAETALNNMRGEVWDTMCALAESDSMMYEACLGLTLQVLNLLLQIPIDISFHMQIPLTITYCPESSIYRKWCPEQGGISPLHKEIRASCTLSKVLGRVTHQPSESAGRPPLPLPRTTLWVLVGHRALDIELVARLRVSHLHTANDQALGALPVVTTPPIPESPKMVMSLAVSLTPPKVRKATLKKRIMPKQARARSRPQTTNRKHHRVKTSRSASTPRTPPLVLVSSLVSMRTLTPSPTLGRKSRPPGKGSTRTAPGRAVPRKTLVGHCPHRKNHQLTRCFVMKLGRKCSCLTRASMLGVATK